MSHRYFLIPFVRWIVFYEGQARLSRFLVFTARGKVVPVRWKDVILVDAIRSHWHGWFDGDFLKEAHMMLAAQAAGALYPSTEPRIGGCGVVEGKCSVASIILERRSKICVKRARARSTVGCLERGFYCCDCFPINSQCCQKNNVRKMLTTTILLRERVERWKFLNDLWLWSSG